MLLHSSYWVVTQRLGDYEPKKATATALAFSNKILHHGYWSKHGENSMLKFHPLLSFQSCRGRNINTQNISGRL